MNERADWICGCNARTGYADGCGRPLLHREFRESSDIVLQIFAALYGVDWMRFGCGIYNLVMHTASLLIVWVLFHKYPVLSTSSKMGRFLSLIGRRSIDVYFIHYFFLPDLHIWGDYFMSIDAQLIEYLCAVILSIPLIYISIGIGCNLRLSPITARLFLGAISTRKKAKIYAEV